MSNVLIAGDSMVVTSSVSLEDLRLVEKYRPDALRQKDDEGNQIFAVCIGSNSISANGVSYAEATFNENGRATVTAKIPKGTEDAKAYIVDTFGPTLEKLNQIEAPLPTIVTEITRARAVVLDSITTDGTTAAE